MLIRRVLQMFFWRDKFRFCLHNPCKITKPVFFTFLRRKSSFFFQSVSDLYRCSSVIYVRMCKNPCAVRHVEAEKFNFELGVLFCCQTRYIYHPFSKKCTTWICNILHKITENIVWTVDEFKQPWQC